MHGPAVIVHVSTFPTFHSLISSYKNKRSVISFTHLHVVLNLYDLNILSVEHKSRITDGPWKHMHGGHHPLSLYGKEQREHSAKRLLCPWKKEERQVFCVNCPFQMKWQLQKKEFGDGKLYEAEK